MRKDSSILKFESDVLKDFFGDSDTKNYDVLYSGPNYINISFYMNHSDKPNIDIVEEKEGEYFNFVANRNIKKGEELFINYNDYKWTEKIKIIKILFLFILSLYN